MELKTLYRFIGGGISVIVIILIYAIFRPYPAPAPPTCCDEIEAWAPHIDSYITELDSWNWSVKDAICRLERRVEALHPTDPVPESDLMLCDPDGYPVDPPDTPPCDFGACGGT